MNTPCIGLGQHGPMSLERSGSHFPEQAQRPNAAGGQSWSRRDFEGHALPSRPKVPTLRPCRKRKHKPKKRCGFPFGVPSNQAKKGILLTKNIHSSWSPKGGAPFIRWMYLDFRRKPAGTRGMSNYALFSSVLKKPFGILDLWWDQPTLASRLSE